MAADCKTLSRPLLTDSKQPAPSRKERRTLPLTYHPAERWLHFRSRLPDPVKPLGWWSKLLAEGASEVASGSAFLNQALLVALAAALTEFRLRLAVGGTTRTGESSLSSVASFVVVPYAATGGGSGEDTFRNLLLCLGRQEPGFAWVGWVHACNPCV